MSDLEAPDRRSTAVSFDAETWERLERARATGRLSPVFAVLAPAVFGEVVEHAEAVAALLLRELNAASSASLRAVDRDFRSPAFLTKWPTCSMLRAEQWARY